MSNYDEITLNGQTYYKDELVNLVKKKAGENLSDFKKSLYGFIGEWISDAETIIVKTSGTTGTPKDIVFRKEQFINSARMTCSYFGLTKISKGLLCLSPDYIAGKMMVVRAFVSGMDLITAEPSNKPLLGGIGKIDFAAFVPLQIQNINDDELSRKKFQSIKNVIIGGAGIPIRLEKELVDFPNNIYSTFSMTETLSHVALRRLNGKAMSESYFALPGVVFNKDERDCLVVNAPAVNDTPVVTNDVIELYDSAHFKWLGRYDHVINSAGIKIHPENLEHKLSSIFPGQRFFLAALPDEKLGQKVVMVIESSADFDLKNIQKRITGVLSKYEIPKEYYYINNFIETASGKVRKGETLKSATKF